MNTVTFHSQGQLERRNLLGKYVKVKELIKEPEQLVTIFEIDSAFIYTYMCVTLLMYIISLCIHVCIDTRDVYIHIYNYIHMYLHTLIDTTFQKL